MKRFFRKLQRLHQIKSITDSSERYVALELENNLDDHRYKIFNDVLLPHAGHIGSTQIDHLIVSVYGIFCIETKGHRGMVWAKHKLRLFRQYLFSREPYKISPNPVEQNNSHVKCLTRVLDSSLKMPIVNIVVFPRANKFVIDGYHNVGSVNDLMLTIKSCKREIYSYAEAVKIIDMIKKSRLVGEGVRVRHVEKIRTVHAQAH